MNEKVMQKIEKLLLLAGHESTPPEEAQSAQEKADAMMFEYKVERAQLNLERNDREVISQIIEREFEELSLIDPSSLRSSRRDFSEYVVSGTVSGIRRNIFRHAGCEIWGRKVVGYEEDIVYAEILWLSILSDITRVMYPKWNVSLGFDENVYRLKSSGYSWSQVREMGLATGAKDKNGPLTAQNAGSKLRTGYKRHAAKIGEVVVQQTGTPHLWRESFAQSFSVRISQRVAALKNGQEEYRGKNLPALVREEDLLKSHFYGLFPEANPENWSKPEEPKKKRGRVAKAKTKNADMSGWVAGHKAASSVNLNREAQVGQARQVEQ